MYRVTKRLNAYNYYFAIRRNDRTDCRTAGRVVEKIGICEDGIDTNDQDLRAICSWDEPGQTHRLANPHPF